MTYSKAPAQLDAMNSVRDGGTIVPFQQVHVGHRSNSFDLALKRCFDILFSWAAILVTAPILLLALLVIPIQTRGWPLFVQRRVGRNGKIFNILKLRTMHAGSESYSFKTAMEDSRLTAVGRVLRMTNVDELPQLFNVIAGDMSLIGPRPLSVDETNHIANTLKLPSDYPGFLPKVRPGLVGLEQINRHRELTYLERFGYNEEYESGWSMSCDAQIFTRGLLVCKEVCLVSLLGASLIGVLASLFFV